MWAHPRRCGADAVWASADAVQRGSSPQVRGRSVKPLQRNPVLRLIPAGAGQINNLRCPQIFHGAHPRRCGADLPPTPAPRPLVGSSPQVRGRFSSHDGLDAVVGLIPAGAGQMIHAINLDDDQRAHPRRCGADPVNTTSWTHQPGSSPQVRGRFETAALKNRLVRLIPAGAGQIL